MVCFAAHRASAFCLTFPVAPLKTRHTAYLYSFDLKGDLPWKVAYGSEWAANFPGSRSAPTVVDDLVYIVSGKGEMAYNISDSS